MQGGAEDYEVGEGVLDVHVPFLGTGRGVSVDVGRSATSPK